MVFIDTDINKDVEIVVFKNSRKGTNSVFPYFCLISCNMYLDLSQQKHTDIWKILYTVM